MKKWSNCKMITVCVLVVAILATAVCGVGYHTGWNVKRLGEKAFWTETWNYVRGVDAPVAAAPATETPAAVTLSGDVVIKFTSNERFLIMRGYSALGAISPADILGAISDGIWIGLEYMPDEDVDSVEDLAFTLDVTKKYYVCTPEYFEKQSVKLRKGTTDKATLSLIELDEDNSDSDILFYELDLSKLISGDKDGWNIVINLEEEDEPTPPAPVVPAECSITIDSTLGFATYDITGYENLMSLLMDENANADDAVVNELSSEQSCTLSGTASTSHKYAIFVNGTDVTAEINVGGISYPITVSAIEVEAGVYLPCLDALELVGEHFTSYDDITIYINGAAPEGESEAEAFSCEIEAGQLESDVMIYQVVDGEMTSDVYLSSCSGGCHDTATLTVGETYRIVFSLANSDATTLVIDFNNNDVERRAAGSLPTYNAGEGTIYYEFVAATDGDGIAGFSFE